MTWPVWRMRLSISNSLARTLRTTLVMLWKPWRPLHIDIHSDPVSVAKKRDVASFPWRVIGIGVVQGIYAKTYIKSRTTVNLEVSLINDLWIINLSLFDLPFFYLKLTQTTT